MNVQKQIRSHIAAQPEPKRSDMQALHDIILGIMPKTREFYQIGISVNTTGISVYIMGLEDRKYLAETYGNKLGKASVTGYCIKFRTLENIVVDVLVDAMRYGVEQTRA